MSATARPAADAAGVSRIDDRSVWMGDDFSSRERYARALDAAMVTEIVDAGRRLARRGGDPWHLTPDVCPLPASAPVIEALYDDVERGPGFALLAGFPVTELDERALRFAYCAFCSHFGRITIQNREGEFLLEVTNKGKGYDRDSRGYHSDAHLDFHNDGTNTVTLLCTQTAEEGGLSKLVSGPAVYNAILDRAPAHMAPLLRGFHHHRRNQREASDPVVTPYRTPVFGFFNGRFHMAYAAPSILFCENEGIAISDEEKSALAFMESILDEPAFHLDMTLRQGDLQFVNNFLVLHARTAYRDSDRKRRRLLRLWLDDENSQRLGPGKMDWYLPEHSRFSASGGIDALERA